MTLFNLFHMKCFMDKYRRISKHAMVMLTIVLLSCILLIQEHIVIIVWSCFIRMSNTKYSYSLNKLFHSYLM